MGTTQVSAVPETSSELLVWARQQIADVDTGQEYEPRAVLLAIMGTGELPKREKAGTIDGILARILDAATFDEAIAEGETEGIEAVLGRSLTLANPRWFPSEFAGGSNCFCVVEAVDMTTGTVSQLVIGSQQPLIALWRAQAEQRFPFVCRFVQSAKPTAAGFYPYNLVR